jgi:glycosyltransferase involved in cell wall biosynthesis
MRKKKVLHIVRNVEYIGGAEIFILAILPRLSKRFQITLCCTEGVGKRADELKKFGIKVKNIKFKNVFDLSAYLEVAKLASGYDLIHSHLYNADWVGAIASIVSGKPVVSTKYCEFSRALEKNTLIEKLLIKPFADVIGERFVDYNNMKVFPVSKAVSRVLESKGVPLKKMRIIPCTPLSKTQKKFEKSREQIRKEHGIPIGAIHIHSTARLVPEKCIDTLVDAAESVSKEVGNAFFTVTGDGYVILSPT